MGNISVKEQLDVLLNNPVLIYGAGRGALRIILNLRALGVNIIGLAVSDISDQNTLGYEGYQVKTPNAFAEYKKSAVVLIATSEKYHNEIRINCERLGFENVICMSPALLELASEISHKRLLQKHGLPIDDDVIAVGGGKYLNPYSDIFPDKFGIVDQWEDICSTLFGDMSMSFEGPYEYGGVHISEGDTALDIGASIGYVSVYAASKGAEVYAFEPNPNNQSFIRKHSELNSNRIHVEPLAVSDKCGNADFFFNPVCGAAGSLDSNVAAGGVTVNVEITTVDEFVKSKRIENVEYIHVNIVGNELSAIKGANETLRKFAPKLVVCTYFCLNDERTIIDIIKKANSKYTVEKKCGKVYAHI